MYMVVKQSTDQNMSLKVAKKIDLSGLLLPVMAFCIILEFQTDELTTF